MRNLRRAIWWQKQWGAFLSLAILWVFTACSPTKTTQWPLQSLDKIGGREVTVSGDPQVIATAGREGGLAFDGVEDGILVHGNPLAGAEEFTIEVVFKPADAWPANVEQRFFHLQEFPDGPRRILLELRLNNRRQWYADFFLRHENGSLVLIDSTKTHPVNEWATMTVVYQNQQLKGYVNGVLETEGEVTYLPIPATARVSLGTRMDQRSWFNGIIKSVRFSPKVENPAKKK